MSGGGYALGILLGPKWRGAINSVSRESLLKSAPFVLIGLGLWWLIFLGAVEVLEYLRGLDFFGELLARRLFSLVFFGLLWFLLISNVITALSSFYLSRDLPLLLTLPVEAASVLRLKTVETALASSWMVVLFVPPVFLAYGLAYGAGVVFYLLTALVFFLFILLALGLGAAVAHLLTRIFPARGARDVLMIVGLFLFIAAYYFLSGGMPEDFANPVEFVDRVIAIDLENFWQPGYWASEALWAALLGRGALVRMASEAGVYLFALGSTAIFSLVLAQWVGELFFGRNLENMRPFEGARRRRAGFPAGPARALFVKDLKIFLRDTGQWSQLLIITALAFIYVHNFQSIPLEGVRLVTEYFREIIVMMNALLAGLVLAAVAARFLYAGVSLEGRAFWVVRSAPVGMGRFLWSKLFFGFWPVTLLTLTLVVLTNRALGVGGALGWLSAGCVALFCLSISGLATGLGAIYPRFRYEHVAQVPMSMGGMVFMLAAFGVVVVTVASAALPYYFYLESGGLISGPLTLGGAALALIVNALAFYLPMRFGIKRLEVLEEI